MGNSFEKKSILEILEIQEFVKDRNIRPEDVGLIEKLATFPKPMIIQELHNLFNMHHERSGAELENLIKTSGDDTKRALYEATLDFYKAYDWATSWNLIRILEKL